MVEKGKQWSDRETKLLLELWSEDSIQRQLQGAARNDAIFRRIAQDLAKSGFERTVAQIQAKIKALKKKYKAITDRIRRSGAGHESDKEEDMPADFPYFDLLHAVWVAGQQSPQCTSWILQQLEKVSHLQPLNLRQAAVRAPLALQLAHIKIRALIKRRIPLALQLAAIEKRTPLALQLAAIEKRTPLALLPAVDLLRQGLLPAVDLLPRDLTSSRPPSPYNVEDDIPVPKKKRKRVTIIQRAGKVATSLVKDVLTVQAKEREKCAQA